MDQELEATTPLVRVDAAALTQALVNLVDNAVKYSEESRVLTFRVRSRDGAVDIEVEDRGVGIPAEEQRHYRGVHRGAATVGAAATGSASTSSLTSCSAWRKHRSRRPPAGARA